MTGRSRARCRSARSTARSARLIAQRGWQMMEHSFDEANHAARADVWERVNREFPITGLRWSIDHVNTITPATIERMKALGVGVRAHGYRVLSGTQGQAGPPYRMLVNSGIRVGTGMDGAQASPINPWMHVYYMVTGRNVRGEVINDGQQITRQEAVWLYTGANGWFSREEDTLGTIEVGRLADLAVLNADVFDPKGGAGRIDPPRPLGADDPWRQGRPRRSTNAALRARERPSTTKKRSSRRSQAILCFVFFVVLVVLDQVSESHASHPSSGASVRTSECPVAPRRLLPCHRADSRSPRPLPSAGRPRRGRARRQS